MPLQSQFGPQAGKQDNQHALQVSSGDQLSLMDAWRVLWKQRFTILAVTAISFAATTIYTYRIKPVYESVSRVQIQPNTGNVVGLKEVLDQGSGDSSAQLQTEILKLRSDAVMLDTAKALNVFSKIRAGHQNASGAALTENDLTPAERRAAIGFVRKGLSVQLISNTQVVEVRSRRTDAKQSADIVNQLLDTYIDNNLKSKFNRTMYVSGWLQKQLEDLKRQAEDAQYKLIEFERQHNIVGTDESSNLTMQNLQKYSDSLTTTETSRILKEARLREFDSHDANMAALTGDNVSLTALRVKLNDLKAQKAELSAKYGDRNPKIQAINLEIDKTEGRVREETALARRQVRDEYNTAIRTEKMLRSKLEAQKGEAYKLNESAAQYAILRHEAEVNRNLYDALQVRLKEASVTAGLSATNISIVDRAEIPVTPVAPRKSLNMMLGFICGLVAGAIFAFVIESIDDRLQTSEEVENVSSLTSLATVPHVADELKRDKGGETADQQEHSNFMETIALNKPKSIAAEAYRGLRSSLLLSSIDKPPRLILFTSAFPGEGKTMTSINSAIVLAQRGEKVLLIDADLRRGYLDRILHITNKQIGLTTVLANPDKEHEFYAPFPELPTLHVLPTGPRPPNPAEMLASNRMAKQLRAWAMQFDRVVIDTAPVLAVSDTQALAALADSVILVARAGITRRRALLRARDLLWRVNAPIVGVVVNDVDMRLENFYTYRYGMYGYRHGYGYNYGSSYSDNAYGYEDDETKEK